jgi:putative tricarboxylic transport membrane protein
MLEAAISGFWQTVAWPAFGYMLLGIAIGFWVGLLPGIGGLSTLALMLPFSYSIKDPISAFAFLLGMLAVTGTTGDLTSILFGIPGEGSSAALILDGYPMSKNGEAGRALGAAIMSSLVGSVIGALSLALSIPIMRPLVLLFGSPELFIIAIMGITFIGTLAGASLIKGLLAGGIGLMLEVSIYGTGWILFRLSSVCLRSRKSSTSRCAEPVSRATSRRSSMASWRVSRILFAISGWSCAVV